MLIEIDKIKVNPGRRELSEDVVHELVFSFREIGMLNPITLTDDYTLIAGLHRLEAAKQMGWKEIECTIMGLDGLQAQLAELDENFARKNLTPLEIGELLKRRKDIYEALYPMTKAGTAQAVAMNKAMGNNVNCKLQTTKKAFIEDTADLTGAHPSTISRHIKVATDLTDEAKEILHTAEKPVPHSTLAKISKLAPDQQKDAASMLVSGEIHSVDEYNAKAKETDGPIMVDNSSGTDQSDEPVSEDMRNLTEEQAGVIMGMAYFTDGISGNVKDFLSKEDIFFQLSKENIRYLIEMMDVIQKSTKALSGLLTDCLLAD